MNLRTADEADIPRLHALVQGAYRGDAARQGWTHEANLLDGQRTDPEMLRDMLRDPSQRVLLAEDNSGIIGCVAVARKHGHGYLGMLTVAPDRQGQGLGRQLAQAAEAEARNWGLDRMEMTVIRQRPELIAWYERLGYINTGRTEPFPMNDRRFGIPLRSDLEFFVLAKPLR